VSRYSSRIRRLASSLDSTSRRLGTTSTWVVRWRCCQSKSLSVDPNALWHDRARAISSCSSFSFSLLRERTRGSARARMLAFKEHRSRF